MNSKKTMRMRDQNASRKKQSFSTESYGMESRVIVVLVSILFLGFLSIVVDKSLGLSSYSDYFKTTKVNSGNGMSWTEMALGNSGITEDQDNSNFHDIHEVNELQTIVYPKHVVWKEDIYQSIRFKNATFSTSTPIWVEDEVGYIISTDEQHDRLVVNVNETYLFWNNGQDRLCQLLRNMTLSPSLDGTQEVPSALLNVTMDCYDHATNKQGFGQGNWITAIYAARMATALAGVDFKFQCTDGQWSKMELLLPWFDKYIPAPADRTNWPFNGSRPTQATACNSNYRSLRIDKMASQIQNDIRNMAVALVGNQAITQKHPHFSSNVTPLFPNVVLDNVAIHFRCGDVLGGAKRNDFGMIRFYEYKKWIPRNTTTIGIITQPFEKDRNRGTDARKTDNCRRVVETLVDYLQEFAPNAKITIHNGINETLPLAYARLAMANYSFTSLSSFGIFPVVGTFGEGYFQKGNDGVNPFATYIPQYLPNIHQMNAEVRSTWEMWGMPLEDLIAWFVDERNAPKYVLDSYAETDPLYQISADGKLSNNGIQDPPAVAWSDEVHRLVMEQGSSFNSSVTIYVEEASGYVRDERLIVDVDESYLFWNDGSLKLCQLLKNITLADSLDGTQDVPLALVNATMDCVDHAKNKEGFGQGKTIRLHLR
jgi:hypothetical protein